MFTLWTSSLARKELSRVEIRVTTKVSIVIHFDEEDIKEFRDFYTELTQSISDRKWIMDIPDSISMIMDHLPVLH